MLKLPDNIIHFEIPKRKPKVVQKEEIPHQKAYCITPFRAASDKQLHEGTLRVLMILCSYTNRAGITWVGQATIGKQLNISKQAVNKQMKLLVQLGYIEVVSKGWRGERANTTRVIFDDSVTAEDAISITSAQEDTRPPFLIKKEQDEMSKEIEKKLGVLPKLDSMSKPKRTVLKDTDSLTTRQMKEQINAHFDKQDARAKRLKASKKPVDNSLKPVDNSVDNSLHSQPHCQPDSQPLGVDRKVDNYKVSKGIYIKIYKELINKLFKIERIINEQDELSMDEMINAGLTVEMWTDVLNDILTTIKDKRQEPPHRIGYFKDGILRALA
jgi:hypothetical protein